MTHHIKIFFIILVKLLFVVLAIYLVFSKVQLNDLLLIISEANWSFLLLALVASNASLWMSSLRSRYYFASMGLSLSRIYSLCLYYIGAFCNLLLPGGISGDGYKVYILSKAKSFSKIKAIRIMFYERVNGFYILVILGLIFFLFSSFKNFIPYSFIIAIILLVLVTPVYLFGCRYIIHDKMKTAMAASLYSWGVQLLQVIISICTLAAIFPDALLIDYINYTVLFTISSILVIFPISIGGIGIRELTFLYGFEYFGYQTQEDLGVSFALLLFVISILTSLPGLPLLIFKRPHHKKH